MKIKFGPILGIVAGILMIATMPPTADAAQKQYYAFYKIKISWPRNPVDYFVERRGPRSWVWLKTCKSDSPKYADPHILAVRRINIRTEKGKMPTLAVHSIECRE